MKNIKYFFQFIIIIVFFLTFKILGIKFDKWIIEYITNDPTINPLMGWESSNDTFSELKMEFSSKELAIEYAKKNKIEYELIEPQKRKIVKKSYSDNFIK